MENDADFSWPVARDFANQLIFMATAKHLSDLEVQVLLGSWHHQTYEQMAEQLHYGAAYLNRDIGNPLWKRLGQALNEKVSKTNFKEALRRAWEQQVHAPPVVTSSPAPIIEGPISPESPFYLERAGVEQLGCQTLLKPGALLRIKAPQLMGKTSLLYHLMAFAQQQTYPTVYIDMGSIDKSVLASLEKLLKWLCAMTSRQLHLPNRLSELWDSEIFGSNDNCTAYFEDHIFPEVQGPFVLGLDNVDRLFPFQDIIEDFFGMLRSWHEKGRISQQWQQLRLILVHSTEAYIPLDYHQSPFNTGVPIGLSEFTAHQIQHLAQLHQVALTESELSKLMAMIGGHPYLVRVALSALSTRELTFNQLVQTAVSDEGIYSAHLLHHWVTLQQTPDLMQAFQGVLMATASLNPVQAYKLHSMGLIKRENNQVIPRNDLYESYFQRIYSH
ncbi:AAA-like domain-containing protein [Acaryochloris sp. CCMEE 5410]|uniref:AAA-like domain-containing protein n=1 Tax=Acaryochloris sp. CCMEE 5410 TaxID=310037 RepID=UPI00024847C6|nr:AAA-like domain-containing protein [Acaryochloris sp. CCMEE 5410]KAI9133370.1 AAA-like domain-containing protein [Acaryochloris sp. CCMEE 5410]